MVNPLQKDIPGRMCFRRRCATAPSGCLPEERAPHCEMASAPALRLPLDGAYFPLERLLSW